VESELMLLISESSLKGLSCNDFLEMCANMYKRIDFSYSGGMA